jgi:NRPS condensation-like uncharacterized protein
MDSILGIQFAENRSEMWQASLYFDVGAIVFAFTW